MKKPRSNRTSSSNWQPLCHTSKWHHSTQFSTWLRSFRRHFSRTSLTKSLATRTRPQNLTLPVIVFHWCFT